MENAIVFIQNECLNWVRSAYSSHSVPFVAFPKAQALPDIQLKGFTM